MDNTNRTVNKKVQETIPYLKFISEKFSAIVNMFNCKFYSEYSLYSLKNFIKKRKDWIYYAIKT